MDHQPKSQETFDDGIDIFERRRATFAEIEADLPSDHIVHFLPDVDFAEIDSWHDPVWGPVVVDASWGGYDQADNEPYYPDLFRRLLYHPAMRRMIGIEQLTLPEHYATIPNAARFSRWEHITGSAVLVKHLVEKWNNAHPDERVSGRKLTVYMLRTMLSDIGHTIGSHLGDWLADDTTEKEHDESLLSYITSTGIGDILAEYNISPEEVVLTEIQENDFVECPSPQLCIDRVDYAVREIHRTNRYFDDPMERFTHTDFELHKDASGTLQLVMTDPERALLFAKAYELLPKEDWSEPLQRLQTTLYTDLVRYILTLIGTGQASTDIGANEIRPFIGDPREPEWIDEWERHPRDVLMYSESALARTIRSFRVNLPYQNSETKHIVNTMDTLLRDTSRIATDEWNFRSTEVAAFTEGIATHGLMPTAQITDRAPKKYGDSSSLISSIIFKEYDTIDDISDDSHQLEVTLPARKKRVIDPMVLVDGQPKPLSHVQFPHGSYHPNTDTYTSYRATIVCNEPIAVLYAQMRHETDKEWPELQKRPRITDEQLRYTQRMVLIALSAGYDYPDFIKRPYLEKIASEKSIQRMTEWILMNPYKHINSTQKVAR